MKWKVNPTTGKLELVNTDTSVYGIDVTKGLNTTVPNTTVPNTTVNNPLGTGGLFGLSGNQLSTAMGLGGLAMQAISLPQQMEYFDAQTDLAKQQLASNRQAMEDRKLFNSNWASASNGVTGGGLASRSAQVV